MSRNQNSLSSSACSRSFPRPALLIETASLACFLLAGNIAAADYFDETRDTITLFAFDDVAIPFSQNLKLVRRAPEKHQANPVVSRGPEGSVDSWAVQFYGSVICDRDTGTFRMWYVAVSKEERNSETVARSKPWRVAYAESEDGIHWTKPNLGLVEIFGNRDNNLCQLAPPIGVLNLKVLDEPGDLDPSQRYKMGAHVWTPKSETRRNGTLATFASADGLSWKIDGPMQNRSKRNWPNPTP